ncbi:ABC transporter substrate-binding protein [Natrinema gelatinilyticum]|uniref:ABC transporter substrate-binding protein n=1 Tax=Natrinema gelatinilyticum TaxID=2961571 RepID=UPI0020C3F319|nr:extracellular solute-binding protein [Natrinema gelatinilyticum]
MSNIRRRDVLGVAGAGLASMIAGCAGGGGNGGGSSGLTIYSVVDEPAMNDTILPPFESEHDVGDIGLVSQSPTEIASRMSTEFQTNSIESDLALNTQGTMQSLDNEGGFREPDPDGDLMKTVEENYPEDSYTSTRLPGYNIPIVVMYNTENVSEDEVPESYSELTDSTWEGRIGFDDPETLNAAGGQFASMRAELGEDEWRDVMEGIAANEPRITQGGSESYRVLSTGEVDLIIGLLNNLISAREGGEAESIEALWLEPTVALNIPTYLTKGSPSPENAETFAQWFLSEKGQRALAETGRTPALSSVAQEEFNEYFPEDVEILPVAYNDDSYYNDPDSWISRYGEIFG